MKRLISSAISALLLGVTSSAFAYDGFATGNVNLRAGPDVDYPVVTLVPAGEELSVQGCTEGWEWCDVIYGDARGWVAGNYIQYEYNDQPVLLSGYGAAIGIPIVGFVIGDYWGHYYRNRPFWGERNHWYSRPYVRRAPPAAFRGPVHDWGHDHGHGGAHYGGDHGHGYVGGHGPEYHGASHGGPEYHGASHGGAEYHGASHGGPEYHGASHGGSEAHGSSHGGPENHGGPSGGHGQPQGHGAPSGQHSEHSESHSSSHSGGKEHDKDHGH